MSDLRHIIINETMGCFPDKSYLQGLFNHLTGLSAAEVTSRLIRITLFNAQRSPKASLTIINLMCTCLLVLISQSMHSISPIKPPHNWFNLTGIWKRIVQFRLESSKEWESGILFQIRKQPKVYQVPFLVILYAYVCPLTCSDAPQ